MGTVYQARDNRLDHLIAIKEFNPLDIPPSDRQWTTAAFEQEARMLAKLKHPGLTAVSDYFQDNGMYYLVMEFVEGETLEAARQRAGGRFNEEQVLNWAEQLCQTLNYLHTQNPPIIFRDIKPSNIMIQSDGKLKLIDFGIARHFKLGQTKDTIPLGTPGYAPPEQHGKAQADPRSDVYALGATLHQLLTGHDPSDTPFHLPPIQQLAPQTSPKTTAVITQSLQMDAQQRPSDALTFLTMLQEQPKRSSIPAWAWAIGMLVILILILGIGWFSSLNFTPDPTPITAVVVARATDANSATSATIAPTASPIIIVVTGTSEPTLTPSPTPTIPPSHTPTKTTSPTPIQPQTLYASTGITHIGDESIAYDDSGIDWEPLTGNCLDVRFRIASPFDEVLFTFEVYQAEGDNSIYLNDEWIASVPKQGVRQPNFWSDENMTTLPTDLLVNGQNFIQVCSGDVTVAPDFAGDSDDFRIRNVKVIGMSE